jgi:pimeloyl-ACP methyl ester carboxylesterase
MTLGAEAEAELRRRIEARFGVPLADMHAPTLARDLHAPLLIVHDEADREVPLERGLELADAWPGARLEATRGLGHTRILRDILVLGRIVDFLDTPGALH